MNKALRASLCGFSLIAILAACAPSRLDGDFGRSFTLQKLNQIADMEAGREIVPPAGMNGRAADAAMGRYQKGFEKEPPAPIYHVTIGGIR